MLLRVPQRAAGRHAHLPYHGRCLIVLVVNAPDGVLAVARLLPLLRARQRVRTSRGQRRHDSRLSDARGTGNQQHRERHGPLSARARHTGCLIPPESDVEPS
eukprot:364786-Chlamydomonas_euryale.AAC.23